jgi:ABC-type nitrate/sulfonate/bicarbonate transport system permease component
VKAVGGLARGLFSGLISVGIVLLAWWAFLKVFDVSPFIGKGPADVWRWLFTTDNAAANRDIVRHESWITTRDAFFGLLSGTLAAIAAAVMLNLAPSVQRTFMPVAMVLRSVPLVAMTPLIALVFGRDLKAVTIIAGIVTFFPTLVNVTLALKATPRESIDLMRAYGASPLKTMAKVQIPSALPALFSSLRVAAPLALVGALLAEFLATGKGLGYAILRDAAQSDFNGLWSRVALVTMYSVVLYSAIGGLETLVMRRFAGTTDRAL